MVLPTISEGYFVHGLRRCRTCDGHDGGSTLSGDSGIADLQPTAVGIDFAALTHDDEVLAVEAIIGLLAVKLECLIVGRAFELLGVTHGCEAGSDLQRLKVNYAKYNLNNCKLSDYEKAVITASALCSSVC